MTTAIAIRAPSGIPERNQQLTGVSSTAAKGTLVASHGATISGLSSTARVGQLGVTINSDKAVFLTGVRSTASKGTPKADRSVPLTGTRVTAALGSISYSAGSPAVDKFPRTATYAIGTSTTGNVYGPYNTSAFTTWAGKHNIVIWNGYIGVEQDIGATYASLMATQKSNGASNGIISRPLIYCMQEHLATVANGSGNASTFAYLVNHVNSNNWWLRTAYPAGSIVPSVFSGTDGPNGTSEGGQICTTRGGPTDASAFEVNNFFAYYYYSVWVFGGAVTLFTEAHPIAPNTNIAGPFWDNQYWSPRNDGSWSWGPSVAHTSYTTVAPLLQQGNADTLAYWRSITQGAHWMGGNCDYGLNTVLNGAHASGNLYSHAGLYDVVLYENTMGPSSTESLVPFGGVASGAMKAFIQNESTVSSNGTQIFQISGRKAGGAWTSAVTQSSWLATDWQSLRYGEAWAMLRNAHIAISPGAFSYPCNRQFWSDTFDKGGTGFGWLGSATDPPQTSAQFAGGVWGRHFQHGLVLCNPRGNGSKTVTIPASTYRTLPANGFSDPLVNTDTTITGTTVTLADGDGRILYKF